MSAKKTSLAVIPSALEASVTPKPSKAEIIDALTELRVVELAKEYKAKEDRKKELALLIDHQLIALLPTGKVEVASYGWVHNKAVNGAHLNVTLPKLPKLLEGMIVEHDSISRYAPDIDEKKVRKEVAAKVNGSLSRTDRVDAILSNDESKAALQQILNQLYK